MRLTLLCKDSMVSEVVCDAEAIYVGSREDCRISLPDKRVPAQVAVIFPDQTGKWAIAQLDDACGIHLNQTALRGQASLATADEIRILDYTIRVEPDYQEKVGARLSAGGTSQAALERFAQSKLPVGAVVRKLDEPLSIPAAQLDTIGRANLAISGCATIEEMMDAALQSLLTTFAAQRAWIGLRRMTYGPMEYVEGRLMSGQTVDLPEVGENLKPRLLDRAQFILVPRVSVQEPVSVLCGPLLSEEGPIGMVYVDSGESGRRFTGRDMDLFVLLLTTFSHQARAIFSVLARTRAAMVEGQVSVAHEVQQRLTPRKLPQSPQLQFGAFREPGRDRSGDIYDVVRLPNELVAMTVAQTPATGAVPSILMTQAQTAFRYAAMHQDTPNIFLRSLNWMLFDGQKDHPLHCFHGVINPANGQMRYAVAGHVGAFIISQRGEERPLRPSQESEPLGFVRSANFPLLSEQLERGETLVLFTSGVVTAHNRAGDVFGEERFVEILCDGFGQQASAVLREMLTDLRSFTEGGSQPDDITVILAHRP